MAFQTPRNNTWNKNPRQRKVENESTKFPGITRSDEARIMATAKSRAHSEYEEKLIANDLYKEALKQQNSINYSNNRQEAKQELYQKSLNTKDKKQSNTLRTTERTAEVADMIRNYAKNNGFGSDLEGWEDIDVINGFTNDNKQSRQEVEDYINGDESSFSFSKRMGFGAGSERSRFDALTSNEGEWNDDLLGHFETESYEQAGNKVGTWFKNLGKSAYNLVSDVTNMVANPLDTVNNLGKMAVGAVANLTGSDDYIKDMKDGKLKNWFEEANTVADGMGDFLKNRYGGVDQIANSLYQDPVGVISDIAAVVTGGAGLVKGAAKGAARAAVRAGATDLASSAMDVARGASKVERAALAADPATLALKGEAAVAKGAAKATKAVAKGVIHPFDTIKGAYRGVAQALDGISEWGAEKITNTATAQDKLYKAQEPRMNTLTRNKDLQKRRVNSDRANQLIVENGYKPTDTSSRLTAHEATMRKIWDEVERRVNGGEKVQIDQSQLAEKLYNYIDEQKKLGSSLNKADIEALEREVQSLQGKTVDLPTLEKKKQLYNSIINNWGEQKVSDVFANGIKTLTHEIGVIEDSILAEIPGEFQKLKNDFGALADTYDDVFKADMKNQRKKGLGLAESYSRIEGMGDMLNGALSIFNGGAKDVVKGIGKVIMGKSLQKARDVDFLIKQGFEELTDGYRAELKKSGNEKNLGYNGGNNLSSNDYTNGIQGGNRMSVQDAGGSNRGLQEGGVEMSSRSNENAGINGERSLNDNGSSNGGASTSGKPIAAEAAEMQTITDNLKASNPKGAFVDTHTPDEYATYKNFTTADKGATISVKPDGDIINFVTDGTPGKGKELMFTAIENGGTKMDNYGEGLVKYYENFGFEPVAKVKFNREYAPDNWNFARDGEPYIYVMKHNGDDIAKVRENYGKYEHKTVSELNDLPELEYDDALEFRDRKINDDNLLSQHRWRSKPEELGKAHQDFLENYNKGVERGGKYSPEYLESRKPEYVAAKEDYDSFLNNMSDEVGGTAIVAPLKYETGEGYARTLSKGFDKSNGLDDVTDIVRGTVAVKDDAQMAKAKEWIEKRAKDNNLTLEDISFDDKFTTPTPMGYKDISFLYTTKNGIKAEVQINIPEMMVAKEGRGAIGMGIVTEAEFKSILKKAGVELTEEIEKGKGHHLYEEWRKLKNKFNDTNDPKIKKKMDDLTNESLDFYAKFTG